MRVVHREILSDRYLVCYFFATSISFYINITEVHNNPVLAFYSPLSRCWELLMGSGLAWLSLYKNSIFKINHQLNNRPSKFLFFLGRKCYKFDGQSIVGFLLIVSAVFFLDKNSLFPGWAAILPTIGACLIISAGSHAWFNRVVLSNSFFVRIGLISFPLYLWHWPLLSFARIIGIDALSVTIRIYIVILSIILSWLTYTFIEKPVRFGIGNKSIIFKLVLLMVLIGMIGLLIYRQNGFDFRLNDKQQFSEYFENSLPSWRYFKREHILERFKTECDFYDLSKYRFGEATTKPRDAISKECYVRDVVKNKSVFIWGDSHAQQLYWGLYNNLPQDWQIQIVASSGCTPRIYGAMSDQTNYCDKSNLFALEQIRSTKPNVVLIAKNGRISTTEMRLLSAKLKSIGINKVVIAGPTPHWNTYLPKIILKYLWFYTPERTFKQIDLSVFKENENNVSSLNKNEDFIYIDIIGVFCNKEGCLTRIGKDKMTGITSWDYGHLTPIASDFLAKKLLVEKIIK